MPVRPSSAAHLLPPAWPPLIPSPARFFCESGLNILGVSVEPCIESGGVCGPAVADTLCRVSRSAAPSINNPACPVVHPHCTLVLPCRP